MRVAFACGGTGGHIYPALAMAELLKKQFPDVEILFFGGENGLEKQLVEKAGYSIYTIKIEGLTRALSFKNVQAGAHLIQSLFLARKWLIDRQPDLVVGTGGYACYPCLRMAALLHIPTVVHESNAIPGLAVKWLARYMTRVWLGMEDAKEELPQKSNIRVTGNPIRSTFSKALYAKANAKQKLGIRQKEFFVLTFGGSLGSKKLNDCMYEILCQDKDSDIRFCHITGPKQAHDYHQKEIAKRHLWLPYSDNMPTLMEAADLVICRAGAMTLAEISASRKAAILIPSPNVVKNHQYHNAYALSKKQAAILLEEAEVSAKKIHEIICTLKANPNKRLSLENNV